MVDDAHVESNEVEQRRAAALKKLQQEHETRLHLGGGKSRCLQMYAGCIIFVGLYVAASIILALVLRAS